MGNIFECFGRWLRSNDTETDISLIGLDNAGKTTLLYSLKLGIKVETIPTSAFNVELVRVGSNKLLIWDVGGQETLRPIWQHYLDKMNGCIFMVDSSDTDRFKMAAAELHKYLSLMKQEKFVLLVLFNKSDQCKRYMTKEEIDLFTPDKETFGDKIIFNSASCSVLKNENIVDPLIWFSDQLTLKP